MKMFCRLDKHNVCITCVCGVLWEERREYCSLSRDICCSFVKNMKSSWYTPMRAQARTHTHTHKHTDDVYAPFMFIGNACGVI